MALADDRSIAVNLFDTAADRTVDDVVGEALMSEHQRDLPRSVEQWVAIAQFVGRARVHRRELARRGDAAALGQIVEECLVPEAGPAVGPEIVGLGERVNERGRDGRKLIWLTNTRSDRGLDDETECLANAAADRVRAL